MPKRTDIHKVMIIGSGPIVIGQACEFDYSGTQACKALRKLGFQIVLVNSNPATIMTDPGMADATYIEPLNLARMTEIIVKERPDGIMNKEIQLVINTPYGKRSQDDDSYIRKAAIKHKAPYVTTLAAALASAKGIAARRTGHGGVKSLQEYHRDIQ